MSDWSIPKEVNDVETAFPASVCGTLLPPWDEIPDEFKHGGGRASELFFKGGTLNLRDDIDQVNAAKQIRACLGSFEPRHEHKEAGVNWLLSMWEEKNERCGNVYQRRSILDSDGDYVCDVLR